VNLPKGNRGGFNTAIAEAELIPNTNPRASEAGQEINRWRRQVETIEDQPYLDAEELANLRMSIPCKRRSMKQVRSPVVAPFTKTLKEKSAIGRGRFSGLKTSRI